MIFGGKSALIHLVTLSIEVTKYHLISLLSSKYKDDFHDEDVLAAHDDLVGVSLAAAIRCPVLRRGGAEHADGAATAHDGGRLQGETGRRSQQF